MNNVQRAWEPVRGFETHYEVSDDGLVRRKLMAQGVKSLRRPLKAAVMNAGYYMVGLSVNGVKHQRLVHRLVADTFLGPIPKGHFVNHINGKKLDNRLSNLEIVTPKQSTAHALRMRLMPAGERHANAKLTEFQVAVIKRARGRIRASTLARRYEVNRSHISRIWNRPWGYAGFENEPSSDCQ